MTKIYAVDLISGGARAPLLEVIYERLEIKVDDSGQKNFFNVAELIAYKAAEGIECFKKNFTKKGKLKEGCRIAPSGESSDAKAKKKLKSFSDNICKIFEEIFEGLDIYYEINNLRIYLAPLDPKNYFFGIKANDTNVSQYYGLAEIAEDALFFKIKEGGDSYTGIWNKVGLNDKGALWWYDNDAEGAIVLNPEGHFFYVANSFDSTSIEEGEVIYKREVRKNGQWEIVDGRVGAEKNTCSFIYYEENDDLLPILIDKYTAPLQGGGLAMRCDKPSECDYRWSGDFFIGVALGLNPEKFLDRMYEEDLVSSQSGGIFARTNTPGTLIRSKSKSDNNQRARDEAYTSEADILYYKKINGDSLDVSDKQNKKNKPKRPGIPRLPTRKGVKLGVGKQFRKKRKVKDEDKVGDGWQSREEGVELAVSACRRESAGKVMGGAFGVSSLSATKYTAAQVLTDEKVRGRWNSDNKILSAEEVKIDNKEIKNNKNMIIGMKWEEIDGIKEGPTEFTITDQEWCHLLGHGDGGKEVFENFVSGSKHCNSEQLAIETAHRRRINISEESNDDEEDEMKDNEIKPISLEAKITAYMFPNEGISLEINENKNALENHRNDGKGKVNGGNERRMLNKPIARWIRYKIQKNRRGIFFDHTFDAQSQSFDYHEALILQTTLEREIYRAAMPKPCSGEYYPPKYLEVMIDKFVKVVKKYDHLNENLEKLHALLRELFLNDERLGSKQQISNIFLKKIWDTHVSGKSGKEKKVELKKLFPPPEEVLQPSNNSNKENQKRSRSRSSSCSSSIACKKRKVFRKSHTA